MFALSLSIRGIDANIKKATDIRFEKGLSIYDLKKLILHNCFPQSDILQITDILFINKLDSSLAKTHSIVVSNRTINCYVKEDFPDNIDYFDTKYENEDAYLLFKKHNIKTFYYLAIYSKLKIKIFEEIDKTIEMPLRFENTIDDLLTLITQ